jgi:hypothetical protein
MKHNMLLLTFILSIMLIPIVSAQTFFIRSDISGRGLSAVDSSHIYISCVNNECDVPFGNNSNVSIVKLNYITDSYSRNDLTISGYLPMLNDVGFAGKTKNAQMFSGSGYYYYPSYKLYQSSYYARQVSIYTWSPTTNSFGLASTTDFPYVYTIYTPDRFYGGVMSGNFLSSTQFPNNTVVNIYYNNDGSNNLINRLVMRQSSNYISIDTNLAQNGNYPVFENLNPQSSNIDSTYSYTHNTIYNQNFVNISSFNTGLGGNYISVIDVPNDFYMMAETDGSSDIYVGSVSATRYNNTSPIALSTLPSCSAVMNQPNEVINDIECHSASDCIFVGSINGNSLLLGYNGVECFDKTSQLTSAGFNTTSAPLYDAEYLTQNQAYFITGKNILAKYISENIYEGTVEYPYALCVPNSNTATLTTCYTNNNGTIICNNNQSRLYGVCNNPSYYNPTNNPVNNSVFATNTGTISWFCNVDNVYSCTLGCENVPTTYNGEQGYYSAQCTNTPSTQCQNDYGCNLDGLLQCDGLTAIKRCVYSNPVNNGDGCLHWTYATACTYGQICSAGTCITEPNTAYSITYPTFTTSAYIPPAQSGISYSANTVTHTVTLASTALLYPFYFMVSTAQTGTYTGLSCNYQETSGYVQSTAFTANITENATQSLTTPLVNSDMKLSININPQHTGDVGTAKIYITDTINMPISTLFLERNDTANRACLYISNSTKNKVAEIYCITDTNAYIGNELNFTLLWNQKRYTVVMSGNNIEKYSGVLSWNTINAINVGKIIVESSDGNTQSSVTNTKINMISGLPSFSPTIIQTIDDYICAYTSNGCRNIRFYMASQNAYLYDNWQEWTLCSNAVGGQTGTVGGGGTTGGGSFVDNLFGTGLSPANKLFIAIAVTLIVMIFMIIAGVYAEMPSGLIAGLSALIVASSLILFAFIGFIPVWTIILIAIIGAGFGAMWAKSAMTA